MEKWKENKLNENLGRALIVTGILLQTFAETPFWLTMCLVIGGFAWMSEEDFEEDDD